MPDAADRFLQEAKERDPERYAALEERFPIESKYDRTRAYLGEPISRNRKRRGKSGGIPKEHRRRYSDAEWPSVEAAYRSGVAEHAAIERIAEELAAEGMRGY